MIQPNKADKNYKKQLKWKKIADYWYPKIKCKTFTNDKISYTKPGLYIYKAPKNQYNISNSMHEKTMCGVREIEYTWEKNGFINEEKTGYSVLMGSYNESAAATYNVEGLIEINDSFSIWNAIFLKFQTVLDNPNTLSWGQLQGSEEIKPKKNLRDGY